MHADEHDLKAADKVAAHQQQKAGVSPGLFQRLAHGLVTLDGRATAKPRLAQAKGQCHDEQGKNRQHQQRVGPAELANQAAFYRHHEKLAERARCRSHAHGPTAPRHGNLAAQHAVDDGIGGACLRSANQHARRGQKPDGCGRERHAY